MQIASPSSHFVVALSSGGLCTLYYYWLQNSSPFQNFITLALCALCYCTFIELRGSWVNPAKVPKRNWVSYNMCFPNWFELWLLNKYWSGMQIASPSSQLLLHWFLVDYVLSTIIDYYYYYYSKFFSISIWNNFTLTVCSLPFHFDNRSLNLRKLGQHC